jgi:hypothetical protein
MTSYTDLYVGPVSLNEVADEIRVELARFRDLCRQYLMAKREGGSDTALSNIEAELPFGTDDWDYEWVAELSPEQVFCYFEDSWNGHLQAASEVKTFGGMTFRAYSLSLKEEFEDWGYEQKVLAFMQVSGLLGRIGIR